MLITDAKGQASASRWCFAALSRRNQELRATFELEVTSIAGLGDLVALLESSGDFRRELAALRDYRKRYGIGAEAPGRGG